MKIVHALRAEDRPVRVLARDPKDAETVAAWGCQVAEGDMTDATSLQRAVAGCETVIDLVAIISGSREDFQRVMIQERATSPPRRRTPASSGSCS